MKSIGRPLNIPTNFIVSFNLIPILSISGEILTPTIKSSGTFFLIESIIFKMCSIFNFPPHLSFLKFVFSPKNCEIKYP